MSVASVSTATATTGTADLSGRSGGSAGLRYVGRFAPSPTGDLHLGSLVAAVGSFLDARKAGGRWLLRMEDLDTKRVIPGCSDQMLRTLEAFGLLWDGTVEFQSLRIPLYEEALLSLREAGRSFECSCSRRELANNAETGYPGTCRTVPSRCGPTATRFRVDDSTVSFIDRIQGQRHFDLRTLGDPVIRRRDGAFAYQLAVVVDDAAQSVSDVVRGSDLLHSTAWQLHLQHTLSLPIPRYAHLPLIVEADGGKLAKSRRSLAIERKQASEQLGEALELLQHKPRAELQQAPPATLLAWASAHWRPERLQNLSEIVVSRQKSQV